MLCSLVCASSVGPVDTGAEDGIDAARATSATGSGASNGPKDGGMVRGRGRGGRWFRVELTAITEITHEVKGSRDGQCREVRRGSKERK